MLDKNRKLWKSLLVNQSSEILTKILLSTIVLRRNIWIWLNQLLICFFFFLLVSDKRWSMIGISIIKFWILKLSYLVSLPAPLRIRITGGSWLCLGSWTAMVVLQRTDTYLYSDAELIVVPTLHALLPLSLITLCL